MGAAAADVDGDGSVDLFVTNVGPNRLLLQRDRRFQERSAAAGIDDARWGTGTGFVDVDLDGDLDLVVVNYVPFDQERIPVCRRGSIHTYCDPDRYPGTRDLLYRNEGGGGDLVMADVTLEAGLSGVGRGLGLAMADIDLDGDTDWFVANDSEANFLYRNDTGSGDLPRVTETGLAWGVRFNADGRAEAGMGADFGDVDGDGWPDLMVANFSRETNTLYRHGGRENTGYTDETRPRADWPRPASCPSVSGPPGSTPTPTAISTWRWPTVTSSTASPTSTAASPMPSPTSCWSTTATDASAKIRPGPPGSRLS